MPEDIIPTFELCSDSEKMREYFNRMFSLDGPGLHPKNRFYILDKETAIVRNYEQEYEQEVESWQKRMNKFQEKWNADQKLINTFIRCLHNGEWI